MTLQKITGLAVAATLAGSLAMPTTGLAAGHRHHHRSAHSARATRHAHKAHHHRRTHRLHHRGHSVMAHIALAGGAL